jgi:NADH-quinone oxidoreductase subunit L
MENVMRSPVMVVIKNFLYLGWNFDLLYDQFIVKPFVQVVRFNRKDFIDFLYWGITEISLALNRILRFTQSGKVRWYAAGIGVGAVIFIGIVEII